jgi:hypothetical protein
VRPQQAIQLIAAFGSRHVDKYWFAFFAGLRKPGDDRLEPVARTV